MLTIEVTPDTARLHFQPEITRHIYDDGTWWEWRVLMILGKKIVGATPTIHRTHRSRSAAFNAAARKMGRLRSRRLFVIPVTAKHIAAGEARNCNTCAIAQALWHRQETMGLPRHAWNFEVSTYAAWENADGIRLDERSGPRLLHLPPEKLPKIVTRFRDWKTRTPDFSVEDMEQWTMDFDEWSESRGVPIKEWREEHGHADAVPKPIRPRPCSFVLDLDDFQPFDPNA